MKFICLIKTFLIFEKSISYGNGLILCTNCSVIIDSSTIQLSGPTDPIKKFSDAIGAIDGEVDCDQKNNLPSKKYINNYLLLILNPLICFTEKP